MVRSRLSISKDDSLSLLADSGVSLSSPPSATNDRRVRNNATIKADIDLTLNEIEDNKEEEEEDDDEDDDVCFVEEEVQIIDDNDDDDDDDEKEFISTNNAKRKRRQTIAKTKRSSKKPKKSTKRESSKSESTSPTETVCTTNAGAAGVDALTTTKQYKSHNCSVCQKAFGGKSDLQRHMLIHSNERPFKCDQCDKSYRQAVNLKNHFITVHENQKKYQCQQCPKAFALKERLRLHMRLHSGVKPYACSSCHKRFARGGQLNQHILTNHPDDRTLKQFRCKICSSVFTTAANLRAHHERHEQGPDYVCELCFEHFSNKDTLRAHLYKAHQKLEPYECRICKETIDEAQNAEHMKKHAAQTTKITHVCDICQAYFTQKSQYNVHRRMHTGERPFQCRICWQSFAHTSVLKLHVRKHTGEKPFQCLLCKDDETSFSQLAHLKTHMKKIHKQENSYMCAGCGEFFKIKSELQTHMSRCRRCDKNTDDANVQQQEQQMLTNFRFNIALLLKKISTEPKLQQLGYEKRLIDNVLVAALKLADRKAHDDPKLSAIERMRLNVREFLNWIVPAQAMEGFHQAKLSDEHILDKIATVYMKKT